MALNKQKISHVVETMSQLQKGFEEPDTRPIDDPPVERLTLQTYLQHDKFGKRYGPVSPRTAYKGINKRGKI